MSWWTFSPSSPARHHGHQRAYSRIHRPNDHFASGTWCPMTSSESSQSGGSHPLPWQHARLGWRTMSCPSSMTSWSYHPSYECGVQHARWTSFGKPLPLKKSRAYVLWPNRAPTLMMSLALGSIGLRDLWRRVKWRCMGLESNMILTMRRIDLGWKRSKS